MKIIMLTHSYPFGGEPFIRGELQVLNLELEDNVTIFPFYASGQQKDSFLSKNIKIFQYHEDSTIIEKAKALVKSIWFLYTKGEINSVFQKKGWLRNTLKAIKFAYTSELRTKRILPYLQCCKGMVLLYSYWMYETAYVGARLKEIVPESCFVTRCHGYDLYEERHKNRYMPYRNYIMGRADAIFPVSEQGKTYLHDTYRGRYDAKISVARLGTVRLFDTPDDITLPDKLLIVSCSNLIPLKRVDRIISALTKSKEEIEWVHFGDGSIGEQLREQAKQFPANIIYNFMGRVPNEEIQTFYSENRITAFVNVSESEGIPVSIMEAQSYAIPVIATDVGGTAEIVHDGVNGVLLRKAFKDEEFLQAIVNVQSNWMKYSENSKNTWNTMSNAEETSADFFRTIEATMERLTISLNSNGNLSIEN